MRVGGKQDLWGIWVDWGASRVCGRIAGVHKDLVGSGGLVGSVWRFGMMGGLPPPLSTRGCFSSLTPHSHR